MLRCGGTLVNGRVADSADHTGVIERSRHVESAVKLLELGMVHAGWILIRKVKFLIEADGARVVARRRL